MRKSTAMNRFIENAKRLRTDRAMSIQALADKIGMDRGQLSRILSGVNSPTLETMERIAQALKCDVREFLEELELAAR
jgi:transcriptional regulator with XRE-family HTH domain